MRNQISLPLLLGCCTTIVAGACYALISPQETDSPPHAKTEKTAAITPPRTSTVLLPPETVTRTPVAALPAPAEKQLAAVSPVAEITIPEENWTTHTVASGENMSIIFKKMDIDSRTLHEIITSGDTAKELAKIRPGGIIKALKSEDGELTRLTYSANRIDSIEISRTEDGFTASKASKPLDKKIVHAHGMIESSLFLDAKRAGLSDRLIMQLANIFGWDVDFALDLRQGDEFTIIYEKLYLNGEEIRSGKIVAAEFINRGKPHQAILYSNADGVEDYYSPEGKSLKRAFLRTPVSYTRISSRFSLGRKHPVLNRIRAHKGVDYAASTGTPVRATGNGKIVYRSRKGGYGRVVIIQHGQKYSTLYAHLSKYNSKAKNGSRVTQGQIIGYVGQSGLATGPHLHYEFRVNGVHRNPLTVELPQAEPLQANMLRSFTQHATPLLAELESAKTTVLASAPQDR